MRLLVILFFLSHGIDAGSQALGGNSIFNFLRLSNTPQLTALGGVNLSQPSNDIGLAFNNPALLSPSMHTQVNAVFNNFFSDINVYHLSLGYRHEKLNTNFSWGLHYLDYGKVPETDAAGNILGKFHPTDWVMQLSASRGYQANWNYGATIKYISSNYGQYRSNGLALDIGILFRDTANSLSASLLAKNMGTQLKKYTGSEKEDLPFELQAGITKKLENAPFSFSLTAQRLQHYNLSYEDAVFNDQNGFPVKPRTGAGKFFDHLVLATTVLIGDKLEFYGGYNFLRRRELNIGNSGNGLNGFSLGASALFDKIQIRYARAYYQGNAAFNQFGLNLSLNKYFGLGQ